MCRIENGDEAGVVARRPGITNRIRKVVKTGFQTLQTKEEPPILTGFEGWCHDLNL
jgi:hypothetical protein